MQPLKQKPVKNSQALSGIRTHDLSDNLHTTALMWLR